MKKWVAPSTTMRRTSPTSCGEGETSGGSTRFGVRWRLVSGGERGHVQVLKKSILKNGQGKNETQDLKQTFVHKEEGRTTRRHSKK